jgi:hypothetical protein
VAATQVHKRLFVGLLLFALLVLSGGAFVLWTLIFGRAGTALRDVLLAGEIGFLLLVAVGAAGLAAMVAAVLLRRPLRNWQRVVHMAVELLFPLAVGLGRLLSIDRERIQSSFIEMNNFLVRLIGRRVEPPRILVLLPHCLQRSKCRHNLTNRVQNCRRCGACVMTDLLNLADQYGAQVVVASGGTGARREVLERRPAAVVAVACERDLSSGIQDTGRLPVLGVTNLRPHGPCRDTTVDLNQVRDALETFVRGRQVVH